MSVPHNPEKDHMHLPRVKVKAFALIKVQSVANDAS